MLAAAALLSSPHFPGRQISQAVLDTCGRYGVTGERTLVASVRGAHLLLQRCTLRYFSFVGLKREKKNLELDSGLCKLSVRGGAQGEGLIDQQKR